MAYTGEGEGTYGYNPNANPSAPPAYAPDYSSPNNNISNNNNYNNNNDDNAPVTINGREYYLNEMNLKGLHRILTENFGYSQDLLNSIQTLNSARMEIKKALAIAGAVQRSNSSMQPNQQQNIQPTQPTQPVQPVQPQIVVLQTLPASQQPTQPMQPMQTQGRVPGINPVPVAGVGSNNQSVDTSCSDAYLIITIGFNLISLFICIFLFTIASDIEDFWDLYENSSDHSECIERHLDESDVTIYIALSWCVLIASIAAILLGVGRFWCMRQIRRNAKEYDGYLCYISIYFLIFACNMGATIAMLILSEEMRDTFQDIRDDDIWCDNVYGEGDVISSVSTMWTVLIIMLIVPICIVMACSRGAGYDDVCVVALCGLWCCAGC